MLIGGLGLAGAHVGPGHEGVVLGDVGEDDQLGAAEAAGGRRWPRRSAGARGPSGATASMLMPALREATLTEAQTRLVCESTSGSDFDHHGVARRDAFVHQGGEAADEIDAALGRRRVERLGHLHGGRVAVAGQERRGRRDGQPLVDHRDAVLRPDAVAHLDQPAGPRRDLLLQLAAQVVDARRGAVVEVQGQRHGAHVEVLGVQHLDGREDFVGAEHVRGISLTASWRQPQLVGGHEDVLVLQLHGEAQFLAHLLQVGLQHADVPVVGHFELADQHELVARAVAVQVDDVDVLAGQVLAEAADDARLVLAEGGDDEPVASAPSGPTSPAAERRPDQHLELRARRSGAAHPLGQLRPARSARAG